MNNHLQSHDNFDDDDDDDNNTLYLKRVAWNSRIWEACYQTFRIIYFVPDS